jgi:hypothetical protein
MALSAGKNLFGIWTQAVESTVAWASARISGPS